MTRTTLWILGGALAPVVYIAAVILGGILTPGYSHAAGPVSALIMTGAPAAPVLVPLFALYNAVVMSFAVALRDALRDRGVHLSVIAPLALAVLAIAGVAMLIYPMEPLGVPASEAGRLHVFLAGIAALATMVAVLFAAVSFGGDPKWRSFARYSYLTVVAILASGIWAAASAAELSPWMGLAERVAIGAFLQWLFVLALRVLRVPTSV